MKKLVSIVLALVMVLSLATVAFAAEVTAPKYDVLKGVVNIAAKYYQENVCQHQYVAQDSEVRPSWRSKGYTAWDEKELTHTVKWLCALCGKVEYEEVSCYDCAEFTGYSANGQVKYFKCEVCGNTWTENNKHNHVFDDPYYAHVEDSAIPMHCLVKECEICGYTERVDGAQPELCLSYIEDYTDSDDYVHDVWCTKCGHDYLMIPSADKIVSDVTEAVKEHVMETVQAVLAKQIEAVLTNVYNSLTAEQQVAVDNMLNVIKFVKDLWSWKTGFNANNTWWS